MSKLLPTEVKRLGFDGIQVEWSDGAVHVITSEVLRKNCPSASSLVKRGDTTHDKPLSGKARLNVVSATSETELKLESVWLVGNYALGMRWADGHDSGIYQFSMLYELGKNHNARP